jgi:3-dehydroquinate dehydratase/shikimate dehydrogenase
MYPDENASPIHASFFRQGLVVFDTVYNPENTLFIKEARERGCVVVTGLELFIRQAAAQFLLFTGKPAPAELMRQIARQALSRVATGGATK